MGCLATLLQQQHTDFNQTVVYQPKLRFSYDMYSKLSYVVIMSGVKIIVHITQLYDDIKQRTGKTV